MGNFPEQDSPTRPQRHLARTLNARQDCPGRPEGRRRNRSSPHLRRSERRAFFSEPLNVKVFQDDVCLGRGDFRAAVEVHQDELS